MANPYDITCVRIIDIPVWRPLHRGCNRKHQPRPARYLQQNRWLDLCCEVLLRLDATPKGEALKIPVGTQERIARNVYRVLDHHCQVRRGENAVVVRMSRAGYGDGPYFIYAYHGERWTRLDYNQALERVQHRRLVEERL